MYERWYASSLEEKLKRPYVHLVLGAPQAHTEHSRPNFGGTPTLYRRWYCPGNGVGE